jgi:cell division transport system ATP-binding protein
MIVFDEVTKYYGNFRALNRVSFSIQPEEFVILVGASGSGKTTLVRLLTCVEKPSAGIITINDRNIHLLKESYIPYYRRQIGVVYQDFKLLDDRTVFENVAFAMEVSGKPDAIIEKEVAKILDLVGIKDKAHRFPKELSGGEIQRVAIARAMVFKPKLLIADEPTGNLDPVTSWEVVKLLMKLNELGTTVLMATHDREIVDKMNKRVIVLQKGEIISDKKKGKYA